MNTHSQYEIQNQRDAATLQIVAATTIERAYLSYRDRQMFILLKHAVRAAEQSWTYDILRKISPKEAELLNDPSVKAKVRFRFAGMEFPPIILFKIYLVSNGTKYISGKRAIRPASNAAADACKLMGNRKFFDQMIVDACQYEKNKITDEVDVTTVKDYMQYLSNVDETPSYLGGKENYWRQLSLEALPRQSIMYDIVEYLRTKMPSARLQSEMPVLLSRPVTQEIQLEQYRALSRLVSPPSSAFPQMKELFRSPRLPSTKPGTQRRSVQSRRRVARMKKVFGLPDTAEERQRPATTDANDFTVRPTSSVSRQPSSIADKFSHPATASRVQTGQSPLFPLPSGGARESRREKADPEAADPEDGEAKALYEWSRELDFDDINSRAFATHGAVPRPDSNPRSVTFSSQLTKRVYVT